jgi:hypothetical protein
VTIEVNGLPPNGELPMFQSARNQLAYALSQTVNDLAKSFQKRERAGIAQRFIVRQKQFVELSVKIPKFSKKTDAPIETRVGIIPPGGTAKDVLSKFETFTKKVSRVGHRVAIPLYAIRPDRRAIVPATKRPKSMMLRKQTGKGGRVTVTGIDNTFILNRADGTGFIARRLKGAPLVLLYYLKPAVQLPADLLFIETARDVVQEEEAATFNQRFTAAMATAR